MDHFASTLQTSHLPSSSSLPSCPLTSYGQLPQLPSIPFSSAQIPALQIRNLTPKFTYNDRNELFYGLGATTVHNYPRYTVAYFRNEIDCHLVLRLLHQRILNGQRLRVEFARKEQLKCLPAHLACDFTLKRKIQQSQSEVFKQIRRRKFDQFNHEIPPINDKILEKIKYNLLNDKKFYRLVIGLMIESGISIEDVNDDNSAIAAIPLPSESEESELENDSNEKDDQRSMNEKATEFQLKNRQRNRKKRLKTGLVGGNLEQTKQSKKNVQQQKLTTEIKEIFDPPELKQPTKSINVKLDATSHSSNAKVTVDANDNRESNNNDDNQPLTNGFGLLESNKKSKSTKQNDDNRDILCLLRQEDLISDEELRTNRLSTDEWSNYPNLFKSILNNDDQNQQPKSQRLYVKNIHKKIKLQELYRLFARYINLNDIDDLNKFNIVYMNHGRMHGQAFVTYPSVEQATNALYDTQGYKFNDRPIVVQYGRCSQVIQPEDSK